jgi:hypothetical protein
MFFHATKQFSCYLQSQAWKEKWQKLWGIKVVRFDCVYRVILCQEDCHTPGKPPGVRNDNLGELLHTRVSAHWVAIAKPAWWQHSRSRILRSQMHLSPLFLGEQWRLIFTSDLPQFRIPAGAYDLLNIPLIMNVPNHSTCATGWPP